MKGPVVYVTADRQWLFGDAAKLYLDTFELRTNAALSSEQTLAAPNKQPSSSEQIDRAALIARVRGVLRGAR